ncbi:hypothetical protein F4677DRAFT_188217 [Hypoxylon crocopeplum]|nr:hypothetical protein F4677DRAFT_188217 [Hypoxylon crocopeplum]
MSHTSYSTSGTSGYGDGYDGFSYAGSVDDTYTVGTQYTVDEGYQDHHPTDGAYALPCEFAFLGECPVTFSFDQTDAWIEHIITEHLHDMLPAKADCWFCDTYRFDSRQCHNDRRQNFKYRMEHIRGHIEDGKTVNDMRPDLHMLDHLRNHNLIGQGLYNYARRHNDLPCPSSHLNHIRGPDYMPRERQQQEERKNMVWIDHAKEERQRKKKDKDKKEKKDRRKH